MPSLLVYKNEGLYQVLLQLGSTLPSYTIRHATQITTTETEDAAILISDIHYQHELDAYGGNHALYLIYLIPVGHDQQIPGNHKLITKPYHISAIVDELHRIAPCEEKKNIEIGPFLFDPPSRTLNRNDMHIALTEKEATLVMLLYTCGRQISRDEILKEVWGFDMDIDTHTVETHIYRIRQKVGKKNDFIGSGPEGYFLSKSLI